ncbi:translation initiation factor IF-2-like [Mustela erminea]|uniref:translation initiation factor IF-2-like n=1 Tax=Mustela erminea TaxID=36723 RepID=UPI001386D928|nr:translation initiation factor IF-2-like [Mustela erminea]
MAAKGGPTRSVGFPPSGAICARRSQESSLISTFGGIRPLDAGYGPPAGSRCSSGPPSDVGEAQDRPRAGCGARGGAGRGEAGEGGAARGGGRVNKRGSRPPPASRPARLPPPPQSPGSAATRH